MGGTNPNEQISNNLTAKKFGPSPTIHLIFFLCQMVIICDILFHILLFSVHCSIKFSLRHCYHSKLF